MSQHLYQFCPRCAHALEDRPFEGKVRRTCPACGFIHFPDPKVAVVALIEANARVLLIRRAVNPGRGLWALPGGYMDAGELPDTALRREVREEVGIDIAVGELLEIFPMVNGGGSSLGFVLAFHAHPLDPLVNPVACDDAADAAWFAAGAAPTALAFDSTQRLLARWQARIHSL
jgi:8-oxo-dGTP diphosphatase